MKAHSARGARPLAPAAPRRSGKGERGEAARGEVGARGRRLAGAMAVPTLSPALALVALEELFGGADGEGGAAEEARRVSRAAIDAACEGGDGGLAERVASSGAVGGAQSDSSESAGGAGWRSLAYGEVGFVALRVALRVAVDAALAGASASTAVGGSFLDIGSGTGRATLAAALLCPRLLRLRGIELLPGLHDIAERARMQYEAEIAQRLPAAHATQTVAFEQGDALKRDWRGTDVAFCCATLFSEDLVRAVEAKAVEELRSGAVFIMLTHEFVGGPEVWTLLEDRERRMSWGPARVRVYQRR